MKTKGENQEGTNGELEGSKHSGSTLHLRENQGVNIENDNKKDDGTDVIAKDIDDNTLKKKEVPKQARSENKGESNKGKVHNHLDEHTLKENKEEKGDYGACAKIIPEDKSGEEEKKNKAVTEKT